MGMNDLQSGANRCLKGAVAKEYLPQPTVKQLKIIPVCRTLEHIHIHIHIYIHNIHIYLHIYIHIHIHIELVKSVPIQQLVHIFLPLNWHWLMATHPSVVGLVGFPVDWPSTRSTCETVYLSCLVVIMLLAFSLCGSLTRVIISPITATCTIEQYLHCIDQQASNIAHQ
jgi:hypothetical protein